MEGLRFFVGLRMTGGDQGEVTSPLQFGCRLKVDYFNLRLSTSVGLSDGGVYDGDPAVDDEGGPGDE